MPTKYTWTGQYAYTDDLSTQGVTEGFGLVFFNARWVDPTIGRFAQPDSIIPSGVQGLDRYSYSNNNPIRYIDPSGHSPRRSDYRNQIHANRLAEAAAQAAQNQQQEEDVNIEVGNIWCPPNEQDCTVYEYGYATENDLQYIMELLDKAIDTLVMAALFAGLGSNGGLAAYDAFEIRQLITLKSFFSEADEIRKNSTTGEIAMSVYSDESTGNMPSVMYVYYDSDSARHSNTYIPISPLAIVFINLLQGRGNPPPPPSSNSAPFILRP